MVERGSRDARRFVPVGEVGWGHASRREQLFNGQIVEAAVLANIERREMKPERLHQTHDGSDGVYGDTRCFRGECVMKRLQIGQQCAGVLVTVTFRAGLEACTKAPRAVSVFLFIASDLAGACAERPSAQCRRR